MGAARGRSLANPSTDNVRRLEPIDLRLGQIFLFDEDSEGHDYEVGDAASLDQRVPDCDLGHEVIRVGAKERPAGHVFLVDGRGHFLCRVGDVGS
jgi:hypothetical protein